jgi:hypothetical protein
MKRILSYSAVIISLGLITSTAFAQTTANGPYYATPSWDQTLPATTRFIVLSNMGGAAVLDRETGLVWERATSATRVHYLEASRSCFRHTTGNRAGWRLPTLSELQSLFDPSAPPLPAGHPFTGLPSAGTGPLFWTATPEFFDGSAFHHVVGYNTDNPAGVVELDFATSGDTSNTGAQAYYWCVRGGLFSGPQ